MEARSRQAQEAASGPSSSGPSSRQRHSTQSMPPPEIPAGSPGADSIPDTELDDGLDTRPSRSASTASRANRLSLTLPILPPTAFPTRPIPSAATTGSFPATPIDVAPALATPSDPAEFITAIASHERRVLELREELMRAETDLTRLKRQWATHEAYRKRAEIRRTEPMRSLSTKTPSTAPTAEPAAADPDEAKRSELERRKALLLSQQPGSGPATPARTPSRRRKFAGGHTRALSLLSPTKSDVFPVHEDHASDSDAVKSPTSTHEPDSPFYQNFGRYAPQAAAQFSKRASWAPQSVHQVNGLKQVAGDLTATLWTFVEDLRQATVGEELNGGAHSAMRSIDGNWRTASGGEDHQSTIRASNASSRTHVSKAFATDVQATPTPGSRSSAGGSSQSRAAKAEMKQAKSATTKPAKHFSWTPLTVDAYDDNDWSSWDSPTVKSPRWSGSTMNGEASIASEKDDQNVTPVKQTSTASPMSPRSGEIPWPAALNRLTPGNIKRTATDLMKEWEKSLAQPLDVSSNEEALRAGHP